MKAAVLEQLGTASQYKTYAEPEIQNENQVLLNVKAAAVKNLDKLRAGGTHYASYTELPVVVGMDGVGVLEDGTRVYAQGISGMIAERAIIDKNKYTVIPDGLDDDLAAKGKLKMDLVVESIENIEQLWNQKIESGKRLVISMA